MSKSKPICSDCGKDFLFYQAPKTCPIQSSHCVEKIFCSRCVDFCCSTKESPDLVQGMCKKCFNENVGLDMTLKVESIGMRKGTAPCLVFVHGGGGNRMMFAAHARLLAPKFCCVLLDLPGHGSKMDDPLTLNTAMESIIRVLDEHTTPFKGVKPVFIGGSLGAYIGMEILGRYPTSFGSAILMMAGQNTGVGRSWQAYFGLLAFKMFIPLLSTETIMKLVVKAARKNSNMSSEMIQELSLRTGMYFRQGLEQVDILSNSDPLASLPRFDGRVLFINGSLDHRDSEQKWVEACKHGKLIVYEDGDHFFSHDNRFFDRLVLDISDFANQLPLSYDHRSI